RTRVTEEEVGRQRAAPGQVGTVDHQRINQFRGLTGGGVAPLLEPLAVGRTVDAQLRLHVVGLAGDGEALLELVALDVQCHHTRATTITTDRRRVALVPDRTGVPVTRDRARGDVRQRQPLDTE